MTGALEFYAVLIVLYVIECVIKVPADATVFHTGIGQRYKSAAPRLPASNGKWAWVLLNPFRPDSLAFACGRAPGWLSDEGKPAPAKRQAWVARDIRSSFDSRAICREVRRFEDATQALQGISVAISLVVFVLFPAATAFLGLAVAILLAGAISLCLSIWGCVHYIGLLRKYAPSLPSIEKFGLVLHLALYPLSVIRCLDRFSLPLLNQYHPVAVASVLGARTEVESAARRELGELQEMAGQQLQARAAQALSALSEFLDEAGIDAIALQEPPAPAAENSHSYCPVCRVQYKIIARDCSDCGVSLRPLQRLHRHAMRGQSAILGVDP